jgi:hypothetical protein
VIRVAVFACVLFGHISGVHFDWFCFGAWVSLTELGSNPRARSTCPTGWGGEGERGLGPGPATSNEVGGGDGKIFGTQERSRGLPKLGGRRIEAVYRSVVGGILEAPAGSLVPGPR